MTRTRLGSQANRTACLLSGFLLGLVGLSAAGCGGRRDAPTESPQAFSTAAESSESAVLTPDRIARNNRGVALMGQFQYRDAAQAFAELSDELPQSIEMQINLAIAWLNEDQGGQRAEPLLAKLVKSHPEHAVANYCLGLTLLNGGRPQEALPFMEKAYQADPHDPYVLYLLGECTESHSKEKALEWYEQVIALDPLFRNAYYRCFDLLRLSGQREQAVTHLNRHAALANAPTATVFEFKYTRMGSKAMAIAIGDEKPAEPPRDGPAFVGAQPLVPGGNAVAGAAPGAGITACDLDGDGLTDLYFHGVRNTPAGVAGMIVWQQADGTFREDLEHVLANVVNVTAAAWGDFNDDGLVDVYFCRRGPNQMWRQTEKGRWEDVTEATGTAGGDYHTLTAIAWDADHDGDLDLFLVNADGPNELLNNNRDTNGGFTPIAQQAGIAGNGSPSQSALAVDLDQDLDLDLIVFNQSPPHEIYRNELQWKYEPVDWLESLVQSPIAAAAAADTDADGRPEIYAITDDSLARWALDESGLWQKTVLATGIGPADASARVEIWDVTGDGSLEIIAGRESWRVVATHGAEATTSESSGDAPLTAWGVAVFDPDRGPSLVGLPRDGAPFVWQPGQHRRPFVALSLAGKTSGGARYRSNLSGLGAKAEFRVGSRWTIVDALGRSSGPGQSLQPLTTGLGTAEKADFVQILWPDGVMQMELGIAAGRHHIEEVDRLPSSCPILFAWNGDKFAFVSDLLAVGGLGYLTASREYAEPDPTENFLLPERALADRNGRFELKLTEPMQELTYLDRVQLVSYDLPTGWQMTLDERLRVNGPTPSGLPLFYRQLIEPAVATNDRAENVMSQISRVDYRAAPPGRVDPRFVGKLLEEHVLTLEFAEPLPAGNLVLLADGWVEFPYSQTAFAAWQAGERFAAPTLEARAADGAWQVVCREFGYPGGMPRQMALPLAGLPQDTRALRLRTNLEVYWDRLAIVRQEDCPEARRLPLALAHAELRESGFMPRIILDQQRPMFEYDQRVPLAGTRDPAGYYTRFGRVEELLAAADGALAIFGPGEEIHLEFAAPAPCPAGFSRRFVLETVGWCKDLDLYTRDGATVAPLPHLGPVAAHAEQLNARYNTRYQSGR